MRKSVDWKCKAGNNPYARTYTLCLKGIGGGLPWLLSGFRLPAFAVTAESIARNKSHATKGPTTMTNSDSGTKLNPHRPTRHGSRPEARWVPPRRTGSAAACERYTTRALFT